MRGIRAVGIIFSVIAAMFLLIGPKTTQAAINPQINFQGKLTNPDGTNVTDGTYSIVFSIYTVDIGGSAVWTETQASVSVNDGIFRVALGSVTSLPGSVDFNGNSLWLGIKVGADAEMTPRVRFTASPYAFNSDRLGGLSSTGFAQLGPSSVQADTSTNSSLFINKTASGNLIQLQSSATDIFTVSGAGDLTFGQNSAHTISVATESTDAVGNNLAVVAGQGGLGVGANTGGFLVLEGGDAGGANASGGNLTLAGGSPTGGGSSGVVLVRNPANSTNGFQIQNATSAIQLLVNTTNGRIHVGDPANDTVAVLFVIDSYNTAGDPSTGVNGATYYNSNEHRYRCYRGINGTAGEGKWEDCGTAPIDRSYTVEDEFMTGGTASGAIGTLGWTASTIGTAPVFTYNNATPSPTSNRPGVLRLRTAATANRGGTLGLGVASTAIGPGQGIKAAVATAAVGASTQVVRIGIHNETTTITAPTTGVWWEYDPAASLNWRYCYSNATPTATCAATAVAPTANNFSTLEIRIVSVGVAASTVDYFLNGTKSTVTGVTVNTTNLVAPAMTCFATVSATARDCFLDYFQFVGGSGARR